MNTSVHRRLPLPGRAVVLGTALVMPLTLPAAGLDGLDPVQERLTVVIRDVPLELFFHRPAGGTPRGVLLVLHGQRRNAAAYRDYARSFADRHGLLVVTPKFDRERFPNRRYQRGGITRRGKTVPKQQWTVNLIPALMAWVRRHEQTPDLPGYLYGHSAGGQFLSRVAAFAELVDVRRIVIANPSSYVAADLDEAAPYGLGGVFGIAKGDAALRRYLALPLTIYLGALDTGARHLHGHPAAKRQGGNRLERGRNVFERAEATARRLDTPFNWRLVTAPQVGHSAPRMLDAPPAVAAFGLTQ